MTRHRVVRFLSAALVSAGLLGASTASAATLVGDYQLQGTKASSGPGPALTDVGSGANTFQSDNVMGTTRQVLAFAAGSGLRMNPAAVGTGSYSVVATFRFDNVANYERILDTTDGTQESGLYVSGDTLSPTQGYPYYAQTTPHVVVTGDTDVYANGVYATTAVVAAPPSATSVYVNGIRQFTAAGGLTPLSDTLRFFKDDGSEESAGAVSCIRVYSGVLTDAEVAGIGASPTCGTVASPAATPHKKKCKKHKKKHRSAESAKKKCKKKKKKH
jgi:hypothetical protein